MAKNAVQVDKAAYDADPENVTKVETVVPGVGAVDTYWQTQYVDDVTQKPEEGTANYAFSLPVEEKDEESGETTWSVKRYEIDLSPKNRDAMLKAMAKYVEAAREIQAPARASAAASKAPGAAGHDLAAIREWAGKAGHEVAAKGRVPNRIIDLYYENNPNVKRPEGA
jgi:uncharacterized membrane protein